MPHFVLGKHYNLKTNRMAGLLSYKPIEEETYGPFDNFKIGVLGIYDRTPILLTSLDMVPNGKVMFKTHLDFVWAHKFQDMIKHYVAKFEMSQGSLGLILCHPMTLIPEIHIPLPLLAWED